MDRLNDRYLKMMLNNLWNDLNDYGDLFWTRDSEEYKKIIDVCNIILTDIILIEEKNYK